ncbi:MAG: 30S ribosomal protein S6 [Calditerrivibrio sp.]|nr:30S ribosomal protein S6 [Calditerrivibrio sp.]MCA1932601.1 30S ribosomal protein S6 [Calditerrivibrio sp.]MCA1980312.1 30S ribosomal protein S6 [Calditerrivibrio sp.]
MNTYETVFIVSTAIPLEEANAVFEKFKSLIAGNGEVIHSEYWGKLKMSYPINKQREGNYYLIQYNTKGNFNAELETKFKYDENVLRFVIVKIDGKRYKLKKREEMTKPRAKRFEEKPMPDGANSEVAAESVQEQEQDQGEAKE